MKRSSNSGKGGVLSGEQDCWFRFPLDRGGRHRRVSRKDFDFIGTENDDIIDLQDTFGNFPLDSLEDRLVPTLQDDGGFGRRNHGQNAIFFGNAFGFVNLVLTFVIQDRIRFFFLATCIVRGSLRC